MSKEVKIYIAIGMMGFGLGIILVSLLNGPKIQNHFLELRGIEKKQGFHCSECEFYTEQKKDKLCEITSMMYPGKITECNGKSFTGLNNQ